MIKGNPFLETFKNIFVQCSDVRFYVIMDYHVAEKEAYLTCNPKTYSEIKKHILIEKEKEVALESIN